jgi:hypothetical protein
MGVGGQHHAAAALPLGKTWYPLYRRLSRPQSLCGRVRKISPSPGFDPRKVQPVACRCTDCAIPTHTVGLIVENKKIRATVFLYMHCVSDQYVMT